MVTRFVNKSSALLIISLEPKPNTKESHASLRIFILPSRDSALICIRSVALPLAFIASSVPSRTSCQSAIEALK